MIKAILFDCDGVLLDTEPMGCACLAQAVTAAGLAMDRKTATAMFSGSAASDSIRIMEGLGLNAAAVFAASDALLFDRFRTEVPEIPGIYELLVGCNLPMAVCSNSSKQRLSLSLGRSRLVEAFGPHIYSAEHVAQPKPAPDMALYACAALSVAPHEAVFIDDNIHGIACAKAAGCLAVGFIGPSDHRPDHAQTLRAAGADHVVTSMSEFATLLQTLSLSPSKAA